MPRPEASFASPDTSLAAQKLGKAVRMARLARNMTRVDFAERARISAPTLDRIERGDVAVRMGSWLLALQVCNLLHQLDKVSDPNADILGQQQRELSIRKRASGTRKKAQDNYDF